MVRFAPSLTLLLAATVAAGPAEAWWEASLQGVEVELVLLPNGRGRVAYDLRHHVDRGRFEGLTIPSPDRAVDWDPAASYIQDARGGRHPVSIRRRPRDGAFLVRIARRPGVPRGFATVRLVHHVDLHECCLRTEEEGRVLLDWSAFAWEVGMDQMTVTVRLDPAEGELTPDEVSAEELEVEVGEGVTQFRRVRPVRWYEMRVGARLPAGFLEAAPPRLGPDEAFEEPALAAPPAATVVSPRQGGRPWLLLVAVFALAVLALKWRACTAGYRGRAGLPAPVLLAGLPASARWASVVACLGLGAYLQSLPFLAAGTLAFSAGVLLSVRGGSGLASDRVRKAWRPAAPRELGELVRAERISRPLWPRLLDATALPGLPGAALVAAGAVMAVRALAADADPAVVDAVGIDLALVLGAALLTGRRRDLPVSPGVGAARVLGRALRPLGRAARAVGSELRAIAGQSPGEALPAEVRLALAPPPPGTRRVEVVVTSVSGIGGWLERLSAEVRRADGSRVVLNARGGRSLARRLRKQLEIAGERPA